MHKGVSFVVTVGRVKINGETEQADLESLMEKGTMKIETVAKIKVERKPGWQGY